MTVWGPNMTKEAWDHCSATLADNTVMMSGGMRKSARGGSARTEVYSFTTRQWTRREDMNQRKFSHSCSTVWIESNPHSINEYGIIGNRLTNSSVLSMVVAGGEPLYCRPCLTVSHTGVYLDDGGVYHPVHSVEVYIPWNDAWLDLPPLPDMEEDDGRMDMTAIMHLANSGGTSLYLLGGTSTDWTIFETNITKTVWRLQWDRGSHTYSWTKRDTPALGRLLDSPTPTLGLLYHFTDYLFGVSSAVGVPEKFMGT